MNITRFLKLKWREVVSIQERKMAFFRGCKTLVENDHYDRLFRDFADRGEVVYYSTETKSLYLRSNEGITVKTDDYYAIFLEIFINRIYTLPPQVEMTDFVVFDVGMNRGYASLFFANMPHCRQVYGFELIESTYALALENFSLNPHISGKISTFNYGLWDCDCEVRVASDGIDGHAAISPHAETSSFQCNKSIARKSSIVFSTLLEELDASHLKVLKIDVEGAEYTIVKDLFEAGQLDLFDIIIGEYHAGIEALLPYLQGFYCSINEILVKQVGAMVFINKKHTW